MLSEKQEQKVGSGSTAIQARGDVIVGLTYSEVKEVALDVLKVIFIN